MSLQALAVLTLLLTPAISSRQTCVCFTGYEPIYVNDGWLCEHNYRIYPCNAVEGPKCVCSGEESNVLRDKAGVSCVLYKKGKEIKRWPCENQEEWDEFKKTIIVHSVDSNRTNAGNKAKA
ncbi:uncharacterized protein LOC109599267 [Aethina tumida]|uniref:uncharacterized protein LOC109599267 n=1 Tax=Aethina tumida TaxID=116153 RepID=UPI00096AF7C5|nr:uncharacterized protein LOC109599267 [Aethina tumida]